MAKQKRGKGSDKRLAKAIAAKGKELFPGIKADVWGDGGGITFSFPPVKPAKRTKRK